MLTAQEYKARNDKLDELIHTYPCLELGGVLTCNECVNCKYVYEMYIKFVEDRVSQP